MRRSGRWAVAGGEADLDVEAAFGPGVAGDGGAVAVAIAATMDRARPCPLSLVVRVVVSRCRASDFVAGLLGQS